MLKGIIRDIYKKVAYEYESSIHEIVKELVVDKLYNNQHEKTFAKCLDKIDNWIDMNGADILEDVMEEIRQEKEEWENYQETKRNASESGYGW